jgi:hypothetical protein
VNSAVAGLISAAAGVTTLPLLLLLLPPLLLKNLCIWQALSICDTFPMLQIDRGWARMLCCNVLLICSWGGRGSWNL